MRQIGAQSEIGCLRRIVGHSQRLAHSQRQGGKERKYGKRAELEMGGMVRNCRVVYKWGGGHDQR